MNDFELRSPTSGADASTVADRVARWRAEVEAFADRINAELRELMQQAGGSPVSSPLRRESPVERPPVTPAGAAVSASPAAPASSVIEAGPGAEIKPVVAGSAESVADRDGETRLRALREQFAAKLRRFETEGTTTETLAAAPSERGIHEHE